MQKDTRVFQVGELIREVNHFFKTNYERIYVEGEISEIRRSKEGHVYISIKDESRNLLRAVAFKWIGEGSTEINELKEGARVILFGSLNIYSYSSSFQLVVKKVIPLEGSGKWKLLYEEIKGRLSREGLFDQEHKKDIPRIIKRVGVITSPTGAAIKDMTSVVRKNRSQVEIIVYPSQVQGDRAVETLMGGIDFFNNEYSGGLDMIVITRGGGSLEDLWVFNNEKLARKIFSSELPVVSAVGHERDFSISDLTADLRAATPTAAAELFSTDNKQLWEEIQRRLISNYSILIRRLANSRMRANSFTAAASGLRIRSGNASTIVGELSARIEGFADRMNYLKQSEFTRVLNRFREALSLRKTGENRAELKRVMEGMKHSAQRIFDMRKGELPASAELINKSNEQFRRKLITVERLGERLSALSPLSILERGYSILYLDGKPVKNSSQVKRSQILKAILHSGELTLEVKDAKERR